MLTVELNILYVEWGRSKSIKAPLCNIWTLIICSLHIVFFLSLSIFSLLYECTHRYSLFTPSSSLQCKALCTFWFMLDSPWIWPGDTLQEYNNLSHSIAANQIKCVHQGFKLRSNNKTGFIVFNHVLSPTDRQEECLSFGALHVQHICSVLGLYIVYCVPSGSRKLWLHAWAVMEGI